MNTECRQYQERFSEYLDDALDAAEREALEAHLESCERCRAELAPLRRAVESVRELPVLRAPDGFAAGVRERLAARERTPQRRLVKLIWARALPVAAMFLLVVGATFLVSQNGLFRPRGERTLARSDVEEAAGEGPALDQPDRTQAHSVRRMAESPKSVGGEFELATSGEPEPETEEGLLSGLNRRMAQPDRIVAPQQSVETEDAGAEMAVPVTDAPGNMTATLEGLPESRGVPRPTAPEDVTSRFTDRAAARPEQRLLFRQASADVAPRDADVQQVLDLAVDGPARALVRAVEAANRYGVHAVLEVAEGGTVCAYFQVPGQNYTDLLGELAGMVGPADQSLRNTMAPERAFLRNIVERYNTYQQAASEKQERTTVAPREVQERTGWHTGIRQSLETVAGPRPETVNLQVRIGPKQEVPGQAR
ncbi:MAG: anti-sigma factor [Candidatus Brocadiia bacterium]